MSLRVHQVSSCGTRNCILGNPLCEMSLIRHAGKVSETVAYLERPSDVWQYYLEVVQKHVPDLGSIAIRCSDLLKKNSQSRPSANFPAPPIVQEKWKPRGKWSRMIGGSGILIADISVDGSQQQFPKQVICFASCVMQWSMTHSCTYLCLSRRPHHRSFLAFNVHSTSGRSTIAVRVSGADGRTFRWREQWWLLHLTFFEYSYAGLYGSRIIMA
jgi:hypothetical protein